MTPEQINESMRLAHECEVAYNANPFHLARKRNALRAHLESCAAPQADTRATPAGMVLVPLVPLKEVLRISDRIHPAWDAVNAALNSAAMSGQPKE